MVWEFELQVVHVQVLLRTEKEVVHSEGMNALADKRVAV